MCPSKKGSSNAPETFRRFELVVAINTGCSQCYGYHQLKGKEAEQRQLLKRTVVHLVWVANFLNPKLGTQGQQLTNNNGNRKLSLAIP